MCVYLYSLSWFTLITYGWLEYSSIAGESIYQLSHVVLAGVTCPFRRHLIDTKVGLEAVLYLSPDQQNSLPDDLYNPAVIGYRCKVHNSRCGKINSSCSRLEHI